MIGSGNFDGYITKINFSFEQILGYTKKEFLKHPFTFFVHKDDSVNTKKAFADAAQGKKTTYIENRYQCKDGSYKWIEWKVLSIAKENQFIAVGRDITERKQTEKELQKSEEKHRLFFENAPIGIIHYSNEGIITDVNEAMIDTLSSYYMIDHNRVYSCGVSLGGEFSFGLAGRLSDRIAAVGSVARSKGTYRYGNSSPKHPTAIITIHGTDDD